MVLHVPHGCLQNYLSQCTVLYEHKVCFLLVTLMTPIYKVTPMMSANIILLLPPS